MNVRNRLENALAGRYRIERQLGEGGMAVVYLAEDLKHHRPVAIKVLKPELSAALGTERFLREIEVVAGLNHPNILGLHDSGEADGFLYFVMPFVEGESLRARLDRELRLSVEEAVRITREIGDALQYAHEQGLVHRDIKPENVLFQAGHALVCDFGIAQVASEASQRLTRTGVAVGTVTYMSPEQLSGDGNVDPRTDVYALGCLLHEMLVGDVPFPAATTQAALVRKLTGTVTDLTTLRPDVPPTVQDLLERTLAVDADDRYPTAEAFTGALGVATTTAVVEKDALQRRRRRTLRNAAAGMAVLLLGAGAWWLDALVGGPSMERIAVLPFTNQRSADTAQAYYVQGLHQDLLLELAKAGVRVINSGSVAQFAGTSRPAREIAADLRVDGVIHGSASIEGDRIAVDLELIDGENEEILWAGSFYASPERVVSLYHEATRAIAEKIGFRLSPEAQARLSEEREVDPQVYEALLQARFQYQKLTEVGFATALDYFGLALQRDSLSAEAWIGIAQVWAGRAQMGSISGAEANRMAKPALARARELDPSLSGVQREIALRLVWSEWNWSGGEDAFIRALDADPTDSHTRAAFSHLLLYLNRDDEALTQVRQAADLDPFNTLVQGFYAMALNSLRRYEEAEAVLLPVLAREPQAPIILTTLRTTYHLMGRHDEAMEMWRASYQEDPEALDALERGFRAGGYSDALRAVADLFLARSDTTYVRPWLISTLLLRAGVSAPAIPFLERAFEEHDPNMPYISTDPIFDVIRAEPRFRALVDRLDLPQ